MFITVLVVFIAKFIPVEMLTFIEAYSCELVLLFSYIYLISKFTHATKFFSIKFKKFDFFEKYIEKLYLNK